MRLKLIVCLAFLQQVCAAQIYTSINDHIEFVSVAPLEVISASSEQLQGVLDLNKKSFAFKMFIKSFDGFNSQLQKIHFYENYMEVNDFPIATFKGKILEELTPERQKYRAKGMLTIHGVSIERIIDIELEIGEKSATYRASFNVPLAEHNIDLPKIVYQKIAEEIAVKVNGNMKLLR